MAQQCPRGSRSQGHKWRSAPPTPGFIASVWEQTPLICSNYIVGTSWILLKYQDKQSSAPDQAKHRPFGWLTILNNTYLNCNFLGLSTCNFGAFAIYDFFGDTNHSTRRVLQLEQEGLPAALWNHSTLSPRGIVKKNGTPKFTSSMVWKMCKNTCGVGNKLCKRQLFRHSGRKFVRNVRTTGASTTPRSQAHCKPRSFTSSSRDSKYSYIDGAWTY